MRWPGCNGTISVKRAGRDTGGRKEDRRLWWTGLLALRVRPEVV